jgi:hypothetical protein
VVRGIIGTMAEPFSLAAGVVGILSLAIQVSQIVIKFGLDRKDVPKEIKAFRSEIQSLQMTLTEIQTRLSPIRYSKQPLMAIPRLRCRI